MWCARCGGRIPEQGAFCPCCGAKVQMIPPSDGLQEPKNGQSAHAAQTSDPDSGESAPGTAQDRVDADVSSGAVPKPSSASDPAYVPATETTPSVGAIGIPAPAPGSPQRHGRAIRIVIAAVMAACIIAAGTGGFLFWRHHMRQTAYAACTDARTTFSKTVDTGEHRVDGIHSYDVKDGKTLTDLAALIEKLTDPSSGSGKCSAQMDTDDLTRSTERLKSDTDRLSRAIDAVEHSRKKKSEYTLSDILKMGENGDYSIIAGRYCQNGGTCIILDKDGSARVEGAGDVWPFGAAYRSSTTLTFEADYSHDLLYQNDAGLIMNGPDSDLQCESGTGWDECKWDTNADIYARPAMIFYVRKGADINTVADVLGTQVSSTPPDTSRPFLFVFAVRSGAVGDINDLYDNSVYYLRD